MTTHQKILNTIKHAIVVTNSSGKVVFANASFRRIFNIKRAPNKVSAIKPSPKTGDLRLALLRGEAINKPIKCGKKFYTIETHKNRDQLVYIIRDVTKQKKLEEKGVDFVSLAAHELRTPVTSIRGYLSVLLNETVDLNKEQREMLNRVQISATRLNALINNLLRGSHVERGIAHLNKEPVSLESLIQNVIEDYKIRAKEKGITIKFNKPEKEILNLYADIEKIREVITNLVTNAILYNRPKGKVIITLNHLRDRVEVLVEDTGIGIPKEAQNHIFEKFFRVGEQIDAESQGTGLGLYISKAIIELHGGKIEVESKVGKGTKFIFTLPVGE